MAEQKKRCAMSLGFTMHMQNIDTESDTVVMENFVNNWGARYERLEIEEAVAFQAALIDGCKAEYLALVNKAMDVAVEFGLETVVGVPPKGPK